MITQSKCQVYLGMRNLYDASDLSINQPAPATETMRLNAAQVALCSYLPVDIISTEPVMDRWMNSLFTAFTSNLTREAKSSIYASPYEAEVTTLQPIYLDKFKQMLIKGVGDTDIGFAVQNMWLNHSNVVSPMDYEDIGAADLICTTTTAIHCSGSEDYTSFENLRNFYCLEVLHLSCGAILTRTPNSKQKVFALLSDYKTYLVDLVSTKEFATTFE